MEFGRQSKPKNENGGQRKEPIMIQNVHYDTYIYAYMQTGIKQKYALLRLLSVFRQVFYIKNRIIMAIKMIHHLKNNIL